MTPSKGLQRPFVTVDSNEPFELRPIEVGGFRLRSRSAVAVGRPTLDGWIQALCFASAANEGSPYWVGDLVSYGEDRADWREKLSQAKTITGYAEQTLHNLGYLSRQVEEPERRISPSLGHSSAVAKLDRPEQTQWLTKARDEHWTTGELRKEIRAAARRKVIEGQAVLRGLYRVIYADPAYRYRDSGATKDGSLGKAERHYEGLSIKEICDLPVAAHSLPNSVLFMWAPAPLLLENPGPRDIIEAWGFTYKTQAVWNKVLGNVGHYFHVQHENLIVATRGSCLPDAPVPQPDSVLTVRRSPVHSEKPPEMRRIIEQLYTIGPYLELFGREPVEGWSVFGDDARLWQQEASA